MEYVIGICLGIGLAASAGFRVFVPLLVANISSMLGWVHLSDSFEWMGTWGAFAVFLSATVIETGGYYIPWLDNALDTIAIPLAALAGTLLAVTFMSELPPVVQWTLGIIAGGGSAAVIKTGASMARLKSSLFTAGWANWIIATFEHIASVVMSVLTVLIPILMGIFAVFVLVFFAFRLSRRQKRGTA